MGKRGPKPRRLKSLDEPLAPGEFEPIRRLAFVKAYIANGGKGGEAAVTAGYSEASAHVQASKLLKEPDVNRAIAERIQVSLGAEVDDKGECLIQEAKYIGLLDPARAFDDRGQLLPIRQMPEEVRRAIAGFDVDPKTGVTKIKFWDKKGGLEFTAKMKRLLADRIEHDVTGNYAEILRAAEARAAKRE